MRILAHMPLHIFMAPAVSAFLIMDKGSHEVNYLFTSFNPYPEPAVPTKALSQDGRKNIAYKMETARRIAINEGYDYMFNVEHDNVVPPQALTSLIDSGKDLISGIYRYRTSRKSSSPLMPEKLSHANFTDSDLNKGVLPAYLIPWGCVLFSKKIFIKMPFTYGLDGEYTSACENAKIERWVHTNVHVGHLDMAQDGSIVEVKV